MGISITCTNPKYDFDMSYGGFYNLRKNIAYALNKDFGDVYSRLSSCITQEELTDNIEAAKLVIKKNNLDEQDLDVSVFIYKSDYGYSDVLDFLYMSDCDGKIGYKTCKKIADLLEREYDNLSLSMKSFRYAFINGCRSRDDYREFILFLRDCYKYHKNMEWH